MNEEFDYDFSAYYRVAEVRASILKLSDEQLGKMIKDHVELTDPPTAETDPVAYMYHQSIYYTLCAEVANRTASALRKHSDE